MARRRALPADFESSSATERSAPRAKLLQSSSRNAVVKMPLRWDDEFWLEEMDDFTPEEASAAARHHNRKPDLTMGIRIHMKTRSAWAWEVSSGV